MLQHQAQCLALKVDLSKPSSFDRDEHSQNKQKDQRNRDKEQDKLITLSQPLGPYNHRVTNDPSYAAVAATPPTAARGTPTPASSNTAACNTAARGTPPSASTNKCELLWTCDKLQWTYHNSA